MGAALLQLLHKYGYLMYASRKYTVKLKRRSSILKKVPLLICTALVFILCCTNSFAEETADAELQSSTADRSLQLLKEGNLRFTKGTSVYPNQTSHQRKILAIKGQNPFATVICSSDSRVDPVLLFDRGLGDLFVVRTVGNVSGETALASVEYSMLALKTPLLVVLGNTRSNLVRAAVDNVQMQGNMSKILDKLKQAVKMTKVLFPKLEGDGLLVKVEETNVRQVMREILSRSPAVLQKVRSGDVKVIGAIYDADSGAVRWLGP
jgi:carbonic anhydrase